jgi:hypothetical protein
MYSKGNMNLSSCYENKTISALSIWLTPGDISFLSISLYILSLLIFIIIGAVFKKKIKKEKLKFANE